MLQNIKYKEKKYMAENSVFMDTNVFTDIVEEEGYLSPKHLYPLNDLSKLTDYKSGKTLIKYPLWIVMQTTLPKKINDRLIKPITLSLLDKILGESEGRNVFVKGTVYFGDSGVPYVRFSWLKSTTQLGKTRMDPNYVFYNKESIEPFLKVWEEVKLWQGWLAINVFLKSSSPKFVIFRESWFKSIKYFGKLSFVKL